MVGCDAGHVVSWYYENDQQLNEVHGIYGVHFLCNHDVNPAEGPSQSPLVESKIGVKK